VILTWSACKTDQPQQWFDYDEVEYYHLSNDDFKLLNQELYSQKDDRYKNDPLRQEKEELRNTFEDIVYYQTFSRMADTNMLYQLKALKFIEMPLHSDKYAILDKIFINKENSSDDVTKKCKSIFRDIIVFKKNKQYVGIVKICFSCEEIITSNPLLKHYAFGNNGEYEILKRNLGLK